MGSQNNISLILSIILVATIAYSYLSIQADFEALDQKITLKKSSVISQSSESK